MHIIEGEVEKVLTRSSGYLKPVSSHSLQPYRGCAFGNALCGQYCYVRQNRILTRGEPWGSFLEARRNAAAAYRAHVAAERAWARRARGRFGIFMSSSTDPFVPQEDRFRVTRAVLEAMLDEPPDGLIIQTHTHRVASYLDLYPALAARCDLRFHISIESDRETLPGLPPPASPLARRFEAAAALTAAGFRVFITVSPLLPIEHPRAFFERIAACASACVIDHFVEGDGTPSGSRTRATPVPLAMAALLPRSVDLAYRDEMAAVACEVMPGRVGVGTDGFAGRFLPAPGDV
jgi:DNA repair photolyase